MIAEDIESIPSLTLADVEPTIQPTIQEVLSHYTDVVTNGPGTTNVVQARIDMEEGGLVCLPPYRIPETKREQVKQELDKLVAQRILEKQESRWSSPMVIVNKPDDSIRICGDYSGMPTFPC